MSKIVVVGYGCPWTVPAEDTFKILRKCKGKTPMEQDLHALELLRGWAHKVHNPQIPAGVSAADSHWVSWRAREIKTIDNQIEACKKHVRNEEGTKGRLVIGS